MAICSACRSGSGYSCGKCGAKHCSHPGGKCKGGYFKYTGNRCGKCSASAVKSGN